MFIQFLLNKNKYAVFTVVLLVLSLLGGIFLVKQRQILEERAAPGSITLKSELGQGSWEKMDFDAYRQGDDMSQYPGQCDGISASKCQITAYDGLPGWTNLDYDDHTWKAGYQVDSNWWQSQDWDCSRQFIQNGSQIISFKNPNEDGQFKDLNDKTGLYRRTFNIPDNFQVAAANIKLFSDNKTLVYFNGHLLPPQFSELCYEYDISISLLQTGENILAIQLSNDAVSDFDNPVGLAYELTIESATLTPTATPPITPPETSCPEYQMLGNGSTQVVIFRPDPDKTVKAFNLFAHDFNNNMWAKLEICPVGQSTGCQLITPTNDAGIEDGGGDFVLDPQGFFDIRTLDYEDKHCSHAPTSPYPEPGSAPDADCYVDHIGLLDVDECIDSNSIELRLTLRNQKEYDHGFICIEWEYCQPSITSTPTPTLTSTPTPTLTSTPTPTSTPTTTPTGALTPTPSLPADTYCLSCRTYNQNWQQITDLDNLKIGETIYFAVMGSGEVIKGRFRVTINGNPGNWQESSRKNANGEFYIPYTVRQTGSHYVKCEVYSLLSGWR